VRMMSTPRQCPVAGVHWRGEPGERGHLPERRSRRRCRDAKPPDGMCPGRPLPGQQDKRSPTGQRRPSQRPH
jgi:hypothetical protein